MKDHSKIKLLSQTSIVEVSTPFSALLSRREAIRMGVLGTGGLLMADSLVGSTLAAAAPVKPAKLGKAKSVIQIWLWGGACHLETFDPKPEAGSEYCGPLNQPIATNADGMRICELLPLLAKHADKYSLIRSMTHGNNGHETAAYMVQTGRNPGGADVYPSIGAVVSLFKGYEAGYNGLVPPYIVLTAPQGRFSEAGFLGGKYKPFATGGDPGKVPFVVEGVVAPGITEKRQEGRRDFLNKINTLENSMKDDPRLVTAAECRKQA